MTDELNLPPLPVRNVIVDGLWEEEYGPYSAEDMRDYAKQAVEAERSEYQRLMEKHNNLHMNAKAHHERIAALEEAAYKEAYFKLLEHIASLKAMQPPQPIYITRPLD
jgi:hypothetical protein